jgi:hypothetical protein
MVGKARSFSDSSKDTVYQKEFDDEVYAAATQQNSYNLGSVHFSDQSGIANISQAGSDQRKANLQGALFRGNIGFDLQTALLDVGTNIIDLLSDGSGTALSQVSTDRIVALSSGTSGILTTITGSQRPGQRLTLYNIFGNTITIQHTAAATDNTILTPDTNDFTLEFNMAITLVFDITTTKWRIVGGSVAGGGGNGGDTGTFISAAIAADQTTNIAVNDHIEYDTNTPPTGADGLIVLQTGAGQLDGIFELISGKTYFLSAAVAPLFSGTNDVEMVWFDITNATELGRRTKMDSATLAINQPKNEIIFTPVTDVTVEVRIVSVTTPANLTGFDALYTFASIFEFSGLSTGGALTWKLPARAKSTVDITSFVSTSVLFDGVTLVEDDRVLLTNQDTLSENGLWQIGVVTAGNAPLTRPADFDTSAKVLSETFVAIEEGSQFANQLYHLISNNPITIDASDQVWEEFAPGTSGGPNMGGGADGIDGAGAWVYDGRAGVAADYLKIWEIIDITGNPPEQNMSNMIYLPTNAANRVGRLVIVGVSNATKGGAFSDNYGATWSSATSLTSNLGYGRLAYAPNLGTNGTLVVIRTIASSTSASFSMQVSTDRGTSFSNVTLDFSNLGQNFSDVVWSEEDQLFVGLSKFDATHEVYTSPDGSSWTRRVTPAPLVAFATWSRIVFSPSMATYYVKQNGTGANSEHITSPDGITWSGPFTNDSALGLPRRIIWSEGQQKFGACGLGPGSVRVEFSDDFVTWVNQTPPESDGAMEDIVWAPDLSLWVVIGTNIDGTSSPKIFWASNDGLTWKNFPISNFRVGDTIGVSNARSEIAYAEEFGYFFGCNTGFGTEERFFRTSMKLD